MTSHNSKDFVSYNRNSACFDFDHTENNNNSGEEHQGEGKCKVAVDLGNGLQSCKNKVGTLWSSRNRTVREERRRSERERRGE